jgi:hypothetical protein
MSRLSIAATPRPDAVMLLRNIAALGGVTVSRKDLHKVAPYVALTRERLIDAAGAGDQVRVTVSAIGQKWLEEHRR